MCTQILTDIKVKEGAHKFQRLDYHCTLVFVEQHDQGKEHMSYPQLCVDSCPIQVYGELLIDQNIYFMEGEHVSGRLGRTKQLFHVRKHVKPGTLQTPKQLCYSVKGVTQGGLQQIT